MPLAVSTLLGPYRILAPLGAGGMGEVYRAHDPRLGRDVAIKVVSRLSSDDPDRLRRFEQEARAVSAINHPNILAVYDIGTQEGMAYIVSELLDGGTLRDRLRGSALPVRRAIEYGIQIARGLAAAHEKGVVHRDLKPENVFVTTDGHVKILDFGVAKLTRPDREAGGAGGAAGSTASLTDAGRVVGTASYMSPEQVGGKPVDHRSDIFVLGVVLYEMLSGRRAFDGETAVETMTAILKEEPAGLSTPGRSVSPGLEAIVRHCLEKDPAERFQSARDLAFDLAALSGSTDRAVVVGREAKRRRRLAPVWVLVSALAAIGLWEGGRHWLHRSAPQAPSPLHATFTPLTGQPGVESEPSLAPDGKTFVYVGDAEGNPDIYLQRVGGTNAVNLTRDSPLTDRSPAFSPDGEQIAFRSEREGGGIFVMGSTGESVRRLTDFGHNPSWSPDGKEIVVSTVAFKSPLARYGRGELVAVNVATGADRPVTAPATGGTGGGDAVQPSWSPHGARVAFWGMRGEGGQRDIFTVAAHGAGAGRPLLITDDVATDWNPVWAPDGRHLYFASTRGGTMNLWRVPVDEHSGRVLGEPEAITTPATWSGDISFSRDGRRIAFATLDWRSTIKKVSFDPDAGRLAGTPITLLSTTRPITNPDISPDGRSVVFQTSGAQEDILLVRMDGSGFRHLTNDVFKDRRPRWSPDGHAINFISDRGKKYEIWTIRPDGSGLAQLTKLGRRAMGANYSPDGRRLAVQVDEAVQLLDIESPPASTGESLPDIGNGLFFQPDEWSRDGEFLVGASIDRTGAARGLLRYSLARRKFETLLDVQPEHLSLFPALLGDGSRLLYRDRGGIFLLDVSSRKTHLVARVSASAVHNYLAVTRDQRWIVYDEAIPEGDVWLLSFE